MPRAKAVIYSLLTMNHESIGSKPDLIPG